MSKHILSPLRYFFLCAVACLACSVPAPCAAQSMFLDSNGDGRYDDEKLKWSGWTDIDIWLVTNSSESKGDGPQTVGQNLAGVASFQVVLDPLSGAVQWTPFKPAAPSMKVTFESISDSLSAFVRVEGVQELNPGKNRLGRIRVRRLWGYPVVEIVPCRVTDSAITSLTARRGGPELRLGPTIEFGPQPRVVRGEWFDARGLTAGPEPPPMQAGPVRVATGILYLGWNRIRPPYELRIVGGRPAANGFVLPERSRPRFRPSEANEVSHTANHTFFAAMAAASVGRVLSTLVPSERVPSDSSYRAGTAEALRLSPYIDSIEVRRGDIQMFYGGGARQHVGIMLRGRGGPLPPPRPTPEPDSIAKRVILEWVDTLKGGGMLRLDDIGSTLLVPEQTAGALDRAIEKLQRGDPLTPADSTELRDVVPVSDWKSVAHPIRLESIGHDSR